jgi:hypothetical protein
MAKGHKHKGHMLKIKGAHKGKGHKKGHKKGGRKGRRAKR